MYHSSLANIVKSVIAGLVSASLIACSASSQGPIGSVYHNTTAKYNSYYIAKERIREIETSIQNSATNDFNKILRVFPELDSSISVTYSDQIESAYKMASLSLENHKTSKWVDDSYILIGQARMYGFEHSHSIETLKYVHGTSKDPNAQHAALVALMRSYIEAKEMNNAELVSDYLKKERLDKHNLKNLYLTRAHFYQLLDDIDNVVINLALAVPLMNRADGKAHINFIIGQIYQQLGFDAQAFAYYSACVASNPEYELSFYAKLNMAQVTQLTKGKDVRNVQKYFKKLLKDAKNKEFKDKIYYELAEFELKQGNLSEGLSTLELSVRSSISNPKQKGLSYLRIGELQFDSLKNYAVSQAYYDSAVQALPKSYEEYDAIANRKEVLDNFVTQVTTIQLQDSLLKLGAMDSVTLLVYLEKAAQAEIDAELAAEKEKEEKKGKNATSQINAFQEPGQTSGTSTWYFDNVAAFSQGKSEFIRVWGSRPLEDNWRRSVKESVVQFENQTEGIANQNGNTIEVGSEAPVQSGPDAKTRAFKYYKTVPRSESTKSAAHKLVEVALYELGNIYNLNLSENSNAAQTFEKLLGRYPNTELRPEVLYQLQFIYMASDTARAELAREDLTTNYPNSVYAKLLLNPNFQEESNVANEQLKGIYTIAYKHFENEKFDMAKDLLDSTLLESEETSITSRLKLLQILIIGKTEPLHVYQLELEQFLENYPDSEMAEYAGKLLEASKNYKESLALLSAPRFSKIFDQKHFFVLAYTPEISNVNSLTNQIEGFNTKLFDDIPLKTGKLQLNDSTSLLLVSEFESKELALFYLDSMLAEQVASANLPNEKIHKFVITEDNFNAFYDSRELDAYLTFFETNY